MREIKFRVWSKEENAFLSTDVVFTNAGDIAEIDWMGGCYDYLDEDYIVQQYTGFQDKNGVDIYEGDILQTKHTGQSCYDRSDPNLRVVKRSSYTNQLVLCDTESDREASGFGLNKSTRKRFTVIGNIHE